MAGDWLDTVLRLAGIGCGAAAVRLFGADRSERAIGTRVSHVVREAVLGRGETWLDRAFVVNDWYVSAYQPLADGAKAIEPGGKIIHEVGGAIMGSDPRKSVTNQWCQTWDVKNLFLTDGAPFCSNADKNPTLTIMALAWRASDYLLAGLKKGDL